MNSTLGEIRDMLQSSLHTLYDEREASAIANYYFEVKWGINSYQFALQRGQNFPKENIPILKADLQRLQDGEPVQYITGKAEFFDLSLTVNPLVLIPRPETEELVQMLLQALSSHPSSSNCEDAVGYNATTPPTSAKGEGELSTPLPNCEDAVGYDVTSCRVLDFCTGSGAIAIAVAKHLPQAEVTATDYHPEILQLAKKNAEDHHVNVRFICHDVLHDGAEVLNGPYQAIVSNPPYIPQSHKTQLHKNVADYEPAEALFVPDDNPLLFYQRIALLGRKLLADKGVLFFETHEDYHEELEALLLQLHYQNIRKLTDINGKPRFVTCKK